MAKSLVIFIDNMGEYHARILSNDGPIDSFANHLWGLPESSDGNELLIVATIHTSYGADINPEAITVILGEQIVDHETLIGGYVAEKNQPADNAGDSAEKPTE